MSFQPETETSVQKNLHQKDVAYKADSMCVCAHVCVCSIYADYSSIMSQFAELQPSD